MESNSQIEESEHRQVGVTGVLGGISGMHSWILFIMSGSACSVVVVVCFAHGCLVLLCVNGCICLCANGCVNFDVNECVFLINLVNGCFA